MGHLFDSLAFKHWKKKKKKKDTETGKMGNHCVCPPPHPPIMEHTTVSIHFHVGMSSAVATLNQREIAMTFLVLGYNNGRSEVWKHIDGLRPK